MLVFPGLDLYTLSIRLKDLMDLHTVSTETLRVVELPYFLHNLTWNDPYKNW
jgi:hypothetical protein